MAKSGPCHLLLHLFYVVLVHQWALLRCQLTTLDTISMATDVGGDESGVAIENVGGGLGKITADPSLQILHSFQNIIERDTLERIFNTSNATSIYRADTNHKGEVENYDESSIASNSVLLMPFQKERDACKTGNPIDDCWRCDSNWQSNRQDLASCAIGFGKNATGGKDGKIYTVTSSTDDPKSPAPGTLRYGATRSESLWIIFAKSMTIQLKDELILTSYKTIDGRGANVHLVGGSQITIEGISNVIVHGIYIHDIRPSGPAQIFSSEKGGIVHRGVSDGDAVHVQSAKDIWIDHCYLANASDGLIDCTHASTSITISNNYFLKHNKVMLFGSHYGDVGDRVMQITVAFNKFGPDLTQRMPRGRFGNFHVVNNLYTSGWGIYAIGGSEDPTILSQGNNFNAASGNKEVTQRIDDNGPTYGGWEKWNWASEGDIFLSGAYFTGSGVQNSSSSVYAKARSFPPLPGRMVTTLTASAGPLTCIYGLAC